MPEIILEEYAFWDNLGKRYADWFKEDRRCYSSPLKRSLFPLSFWKQIILSVMGQEWVGT